MTLAAICAVPSVLTRFGLLEGKKATCHPDFEDKMTCALVTVCFITKIVLQNDEFCAKLVLKT
ncbi:MAG TPA: hypothetical protein DEO39_08330 [Clostridiales bacterium]|nr:hypothetical protein [Clostridiales bacterium]